MSLPIAITMGDPAGIGAEIAVKAMKNHELSGSCFIIGDLNLLVKTVKKLQIDMPINLINDELKTRSKMINVLAIDTNISNKYSIGKVNAICGMASFGYIKKSIDLALKKQIGAIVTGPINKESLSAAGYNYPGHTEIFAEYTNTKNYSMMFMLDSVCVAHVTTHCSLRNALDAISKKLVHRHIKLLHKTLLSLGYNKPTIAVGGINPHAGEHGLFGTEEQEHILPAIKQSQKMGINVIGPLPPDTIFMRAFRKEFNGIVSMLHDHGFVALKSRNFEDGVNITIGLPIIRTSVGHGTAFEIAGKGIASENGLLAAISVAQRMVESSFLEHSCKSISDQ